MSVEQLWKRMTGQAKGKSETLKAMPVGAEILPFSVAEVVQGTDYTPERMEELLRKEREYDALLNDVHVRDAEKRQQRQVMLELSQVSMTIAESVESQSDRTQLTAEQADKLKDEFETAVNALSTLLGTVDDTLELNDEAKSELKKLIDSGEQTQENINGISEATRQFSMMMKDILSFVSVIDEVSAQTNLLSLNASIEAARAGQYGLGFGVISQEVRKLSVSTKEQASSIRQKVEGVLTAVKGLENQVEHSLEVLHNQRKASSSAQATFSIVASTLEEVKEGVNEVEGTFNVAEGLRASLTEGLNVIAEHAGMVSASTEQMTASIHLQVEQGEENQQVSV